MPKDFITQHRLGMILGDARLKRLCRNGWLAPVERTRSHGRFGTVLFSLADVRAVIKRLERGEFLRPDLIASKRVKAYRLRVTGGPGSRIFRVRPESGFDEFLLNF